MIALALALALLLLFTMLGAGPSLWLLGPRWRALWPAFAPIVGFALVVVLADVPSWFLPASAYAWPLFGALGIVSAALLYRQRPELNRASLVLFVPPLALLPWALAPYLSLDTLTTLSEHNHDWMYYLNLEASLGQLGYRDSWSDTGDHFHDMGAVLRRGGWRAGISLAGSSVSAISGLAPHQVDGVLWGVLYACFPGAVHAAHRMLVPRASRASRAFVLASAALSGPALLLLRMSFASHLASLPLMTLLLPVAWRGLRARGPELRALATLLLAAAISVLADASPYLALLGLVLVLAARHAGHVPWSRLAPRAAWALAAPAIVPFSIWRIVLSIRSLQITGYHPPAARFDANLGALLPATLGQHVHDLDWSAEPRWLAALVGLACIVGGGALFESARIRPRSVRVALLVPLAVGGALAVACDLAELSYPAWKIALTTSPFVAIALGASLERGSRSASTAAALLLVTQAVTLGAAILRAPDRIGILPDHEALVARLAEEPGEVFLMGHHAGSEGVGHEHALAYLLARHGRALHGIPHPASYLRISWPEPELAVRGEERLLVVTTDEDRVLGGGTVLLRSGVFTVLEPTPGSTAASITFGDGFLPREEEPDRVFRWADARASFFVDLPTPDSCLSATLRGTPDGDASGLLVTVTALAPHAFAADPTVVLASGVVPLTFDWTEQTLVRADGVARTVHVQIDYLGRRGPERVDGRPIHFAMGDLALRRGQACPERP